ncbi:MAG: hypothetical protein A3A33_04505 [Candidatus Yanofskybacteria bacterium RIFCSPLOWO2_01_FULL_49_25]|uniref:Uncharacterized protein n=1 Tax=Candidatus Yanofskybacteria bacterium RIFCSPLOWO2_01_FULL_49_25 TaxID=1802701 RepID=A0A1F8GWE4_9BACT|nr:MAG: hypothetical protein A3A33_04505 [Candidatus Yanofskybacteria bacterium RIFCSPLOWO2_01_FULL_49_25]
MIEPRWELVSHPRRQSDVVLLCEFLGNVWFQLAKLVKHSDTCELSELVPAHGEIKVNFDLAIAWWDDALDSFTNLLETPYCIIQRCYRALLSGSHLFSSLDG